MEVESTHVFGGNVTTGTVYLTGYAPNGGYTVNLTSTQPTVKRPFATGHGWATVGLNTEYVWFAAVEDSRWAGHHFAFELPRDSIGRAMRNGARIYWVCPLVEESETSDLAAATERHADLKRLFGDRVGLVHGRMKGSDKDTAMAAFQRGDRQILVATTVIEVGVDVPEASVMVIEQLDKLISKVRRDCE